jgi:hypothetical protein
MKIFPSELSRLLNNLTVNHLKIIEILIPEMDRQARVARNNKTNLPIYPNLHFFFDLITQNCSLDKLVIFLILQDYERQGLLMKANQIVWAVTDKGDLYFRKIIELCSATEPKNNWNEVKSRIFNSKLETQSPASTAHRSAVFVQAPFP